MKLYIKWDDDENKLIISKKIPKNQKIINPENDDNTTLCKYNAYDSSNEFNFTRFHFDDDIKYIYYLIYNEDGEGGSYLNDNEIYIFDNKEDLLEMAKDTLDFCHDERCYDCKENKTSEEQCIKNHLKELKNTKGIEFTGYKGLGNLSWFRQKIE